MKPFYLFKHADFPGVIIWVHRASGGSVCQMDEVEFWKVVNEGRK